MEVNNSNTSLTSQLTAQALGNTTQRPVQANTSDPRPVEQTADGTFSRRRPTSQAVVRVQGGRTAEELGLSSAKDLEAAKANVSKLASREAPLGRLSNQQSREPVPLGQYVDIRV